MGGMIFNSVWVGALPPPGRVDVRLEALKDADLIRHSGGDGRMQARVAWLDPETRTGVLRTACTEREGRTSGMRP